MKSILKSGQCGIFDSAGMKQYYAVVDTDVLVSALLASLKNRATPPLQIIDCLLDETIIPVYDEEILSEYREVLHRKKFDFSDDAIDNLMNAIISLGFYSDRIPADDECRDPKDIVFYEVTLSLDGAYLITGNIKYFPSKPFVITPAQMLELIASDSVDALAVK